MEKKIYGSQVPTYFIEGFQFSIFQKSRTKKYEMIIKREQKF